MEMIRSVECFGAGSEEEWGPRRRRRGGWAIGREGRLKILEASSQTAEVDGVANFRPKKH